MANVLVEEQSLQNIANAIRTQNGKSDTYTPYEMSDAILAIQFGTDTSSATATVDDILEGKTAFIASGKQTGTMPEVPHNAPVLSQSGATITAKHTIETGHVTGGTVEEKLILQTKTADDMTVSGATVTAPAGYYETNARKSVNTVTHPKPTLSQSGSTITAKHVQDEGYVSAGTTTDTLTLSSGSAKTPDTTITANPTITINNGVITASVSASQNITPTTTSGYITSGTSGKITISGSNTYNLPVYNGTVS